MTQRKNGRLLIISNMSHHVIDGEVVGHGATVRELSRLATLFDDVRHIGNFYPGAFAPSELPYTTDNVTLVPLPPAGGPNLGHKLNYLRLVPLYIRTILRELPEADVVHVRAPANIPLITLIILSLVAYPHKRWIKYAGNWRIQSLKPFSYSFQRWWLKKGFTRSQVTINSTEPHLPTFFHTFYNPCLTDEERQQGLQVARTKSLTTPVRLLFVGHLNRSKGVHRALEIVRMLKEKGIDFHFDLVGGGPQQAAFEGLAQQLDVMDVVTFHGALPRTILPDFYRQSHFLLFPSDSEGWPKVVSEALAYGTVPLAGDISGVKENLIAIGSGRALPPEDRAAFVSAIQDYISNPKQWQAEALSGAENSDCFTYSYYLKAVESMLDLESIPDGIQTTEDYV